MSHSRSAGFGRFLAGFLLRGTQLVVGLAGRVLELLVQLLDGFVIYRDALLLELGHGFFDRRMRFPQFLFRLSVRVGETTGQSVAAVRGVETRKRLDTATAAIEADPFVRDLVEAMGAQVVVSSIRPAGENDTDATGEGRAKS